MGSQIARPDKPSRTPSSSAKRARKTGSGTLDLYHLIPSPEKPAYESDDGIPEPSSKRRKGDGGGVASSSQRDAYHDDWVGRVNPAFKRKGAANRSPEVPNSPSQRSAKKKRKGGRGEESDESSSGESDYRAIPVTASPPVPSSFNSASFNSNALKAPSSQGFDFLNDRDTAGSTASEDSDDEPPARASNNKVKGRNGGREESPRKKTKKRKGASSDEEAPRRLDFSAKKPKQEKKGKGGEKSSQYVYDDVSDVSSGEETSIPGAASHAQKGGAAKGNQKVPNRAVSELRDSERAFAKSFVPGSQQDGDTVPDSAGGEGSSDDSSDDDIGERAYQAVRSSQMDLADQDESRSEGDESGGESESGAKYLPPHFSSAPAKAPAKAPATAPAKAPAKEVPETEGDSSSSEDSGDESEDGAKYLQSHFAPAPAKSAKAPAKPPAKAPAKEVPETEGDSSSTEDSSEDDSASDDSSDDDAEPTPKAAPTLSKAAPAPKKDAPASSKSAPDAPTPNKAASAKGKAALASKDAPTPNKAASAKKKDGATSKAASTSKDAPTPSKVASAKKDAAASKAASASKDSPTPSKSGQARNKDAPTSSRKVQARGVNGSVSRNMSPPPSGQSSSQRKIRSAQPATTGKPVPLAQVSTPRERSDSAAPSVNGQTAEALGPLDEDEQQRLSDAIGRFLEAQEIEEAVIPTFVKGEIKADVQGMRLQRAFWDEIYAALPNRATRYLRAIVQRRYRVYSENNKWSQQEDERLVKLAKEHDKDKYKWQIIGPMMDRTPEECRDRYRNYALCGTARTIGPWTGDDLRELLGAVSKFIPEDAEDGDRTFEDCPKYEIDWAEISSMIGGKRSRQQCLAKWNYLRVNPNRVKVRKLLHGSQPRMTPDLRIVLMQVYSTPEESLRRLVGAIATHVPDGEKPVKWQALEGGVIAKELKLETLNVIWMRLRNGLAKNLRGRSDQECARRIYDMAVEEACLEEMVAKHEDIEAEEEVLKEPSKTFSTRASFLVGSS